MTEQPDRPRFIERSEPAQTPAEVKRRRSAAMIAVGLLLFVFGGLLAAYGTGDGPGFLLYGLLGIGLLIAGLVIRP